MCQSTPDWHLIMGLNNVLFFSMVTFFPPQNNTYFTLARLPLYHIYVLILWIKLHFASCKRHSLHETDASWLIFSAAAAPASLRPPPPPPDRPETSSNWALSKRSLLSVADSCFWLSHLRPSNQLLPCLNWSRDSKWGKKGQIIVSP